jgi:hypothetical protein
LWQITAMRAQQRCSAALRVPGSRRVTSSNLGDEYLAWSFAGPLGHVLKTTCCIRMSTRARRKCEQHINKTRTPQRLCRLTATRPRRKSCNRPLTSYLR